MEDSDASKKSLTDAFMQTYACFNVFLNENIASYRCFRGVVQVFVRAIGGKRGSRWIQQRGALRGPATPRSPAARAAPPTANAVARARGARLAAGAAGGPLAARQPCSAPTQPRPPAPPPQTASAHLKSGGPTSRLLDFSCESVVTSAITSSCQVLASPH